MRSDDSHDAERATKLRVLDQYKLIKVNTPKQKKPRNLILRG